MKQHLFLTLDEKANSILPCCEVQASVTGSRAARLKPGMRSAEQNKPVAASSQKRYLTASLLWAVLCLIKETGNRSKMAEEERVETLHPRVGP